MGRKIVSASSATQPIFHQDNFTVDFKLRFRGYALLEEGAKVRIGYVDRSHWSDWHHVGSRPNIWLGLPCPDHVTIILLPYCHITLLHFYIAIVFGSSYFVVAQE